MDCNTFAEDVKEEASRMEFETKICPECDGSKGFFDHGQMCMCPCDTCGGYGYVEDYDNPIKENTGMNYSTAVMLINTNIRAVKVTYEPDTDKAKQNRVIYKTLDQSISKGDFVVVPTDTRHNLTVVQVDEVDVEVDFESSVEVKWIVSKVATEDSARILKEETKWIEALKASEKRRKREEIKKNMLDMYNDDGIEKMPIANFSDVKAIEHTTE